MFMKSSAQRLTQVMSSITYYYIQCALQTDAGVATENNINVILALKELKLGRWATNQNLH